MPLSLRLLGGFSLRVSGEERRPGRLGARVLALLALRANRPVERRWLAGVLWPETDEERGLFYLRRTLTELRTVLGEATEHLTRPGPSTLLLQLHPDQCDLVAFDTCPTLTNYSGALLEGWYDDWVLPERTAREQRFLETLERCAAQTSHPAEAVPLLRRALALEPTRARAVRALIEALGTLGEVAEAQTVYRAYRQTLRESLLGEPEPELAALVEQLKLPSTPHPTVAPKRVLPALPAALTRLIGRGQAVQQVEERLNEARLVTLLGVGGIGKTRLALRVLQSQEHEGVGVACAFLAELTDPELLWEALARALGIPAVAAGRRGDARENVLVTLGRQRLLLCLDNAEHLLAPVATLAQELLERCPSLHLLVTSRQPLGIAGECCWPVPPLALADACLLFQERARAAGGEFLETDEATIQTLVTHLDGIPLALEMAAARSAQLSPEEILRGLTDRFGLLTSGSRTAAPRHQTLQQTLDWSYDLLPNDQQHLLQSLACFAGAWSREAAEQVCGASLESLTGLVQHSLVVAERGTPTRYRFLETVRDYATQKLAETDEAERVARIQRRDGYFLAWLPGRHPEEARTELANLRRVWDEARARRDGTTAQQLIAHWAFYLQQHGTVIGDTDRLRETFSLPHEPGDFLASARCGAANIAYAEGRFLEAEQWANEALALCPDGEGYHILGRTYQELARYTEAEAALRKALECFRDDGNRAKVASALLSLSMVVCNVGRADEAVELAEEALEWARTASNPLQRVGFIEKLGVCHFYRRDLPQAERYFDEALSLARSLGHEGAAASVLGGLAEVALLRGDAERSYTLSKQTLECWLRLGAAKQIAAETFGVANAALLIGKGDEAWELWREALPLLEGMGRRRDVAELVGWVGRALVSAGLGTEGAALIAAAVAELNALHAPTTAQFVATFLDEPYSGPTAALDYASALAQTRRWLSRAVPRQTQTD